jgi:DNA-binding MarR family transcriptional regulator
MVKWLTLAMDEQGIGRRCPAAGSRKIEAATAAWVALARMVQSTEKLLTGQLKCHGLNAGQMDVLVTAGDVEGLTQQELAARLCHSKANVSQLVDKMERAGHLRRVPEGRAFRIYLTDEGRALLETVLPQQERIIAAQFAELTDAERAELFRLAALVDPGSNASR